MRDAMYGLKLSLSTSESENKYLRKQRAELDILRTALQQLELEHAACAAPTSATLDAGQAQGSRQSWLNMIHITNS